MPQWAGSSWYYLRYIDPKNSDELVEKSREKYWSPVDMYVGGAEHATRHLIYARFWHKFLYDIGVVNYEEPFIKLQHVGLINGEDGRKMSKRWGNVVNPDTVIENVGADSLRLFEMFMGPFDQSISWSNDGVVGPRRFLEKIWNLAYKINNDSKINKDTEILLNKTIKKVSQDIESFSMNTAVSQMMVLVNSLTLENTISRNVFENVLKILAPFAPHITEELWRTILNNSKSIHLEEWPQFDNNLTISDKIKIVIQVNGKVRGTIDVEYNVTEDKAFEESMTLDSVKKWVDSSKIKKIVFVKNKLLNIVI